MVVSVARSTRAEKVLENDRRLRAALEDTIVASGWSSVTFTGVAKRAGLTVGAVYARAETPSELGNDLWTESIEGFFTASTEHLLESVETGDVDRIRSFAAEWDAQQLKVSALVEMLIATLFDDELAEGAGASARNLLARHCTPSRPDDAHRAAVATLMLSFFLGRALALRSTGTLPPLSGGQLKVFAGYPFAKPADIRATKPTPLVFRRNVAIEGGEDVTALDHGVIDVLGRVGYRGCTIARIARAVGMSKGALSTRYTTKAQLIADAASRTILTPLEVWSQYAPVVEAEGPFLARALFLAEFLKPEHREMWRINLELAHLALAIPEFAQFATPSDTLQHTHLGVMLVACFVDDLDRLPFAGPFGAGSAT